MSTFDGNWRELQLETLVDMSLSIGGVRGEADLVDEHLQRAVGTLDASVGLVASLESGGREVVVRAEGLDTSLEALRQRFPADLLERLAAGRVVRTESRDPSAPRELMAAPLLFQQRLLGMVVLGDKQSREGWIAFTESDERFLLSLASMVAAAVATSRRVAAIERERVRLEEENRVLRDVSRRSGFVGSSPPIEAMLDLVRRVSPTDVNVMLRGESGVGKERVAQMLHEQSQRSKGPFVPLNCAALPESLLEAELFGIEEGVATGVRQRLGKLELADGGTLFLDEVGDLSLALQAKLLRVVQEREFERLGGRERIPVDLRLVTATHRDLEAMVDAGDFRSDLYYRLRVVVIMVPPLRDRRSDIPLLVRHFLEVYGERFGRPGLMMDRDAVELLANQGFPGNVRELENMVQAMVALASGDVITVADLGIADDSDAVVGRGERMTLADLERRHIERVLREVGGNRSEAARILGIDRSTLYRKMSHSATADA
jgi:transcriptional regulator with GAF, ATPase, and Fis domain